MNENLIFCLCLLVGGLGIAIVIAIIILGLKMFNLKTENDLINHPVWEHLINCSLKYRNNCTDISRQVSESYNEYLQRRNEFWTTYGQVIIAILISTLLSILLISKVISAEAGLPILSGISGFAIAKGVSGSKTISIPQNRQQPNE